MYLTSVLVLHCCAIQTSNCITPSLGGPQKILTALLTLTTTLASETGDTFIKGYDAVMNIVDHGVVLIIIFARVSRMLGHRSQGIELLMSAAIGYIIVMHAIDIRDFLKELSAP